MAMTIRLSHLLSAAALTLSVGISGQASAGGAAGSIVAGPLGKATAPQVLPPGAKSILVSGFSGVSATGGAFTPVDAGTTITCKKTCSIAASSFVQFGTNSPGNVYAVCVSIDGTFLTCPYGGQTNDSFFQTENNLAFGTGLAPGSHLVQTALFVGSTTTIDNYYIRYDVLK
jgi:hypothetical protein